MKTITLASTSKFKSEIFTRTGLKHYSMAPACKEKSDAKNPYKYVMDLASAKASSLIEKANTDLIIGLDTIVLINNKIVEKPVTLEEARQNLLNSRNNVSKVITGIAIVNMEQKDIYVSYQETNVYFKDITLEDIDYYLANEKDVMYASGFIIENIASNFIDKIEGSYYNILGAPVEKIYEQLNCMGIYLKDINS